MLGSSQVMSDFAYVTIGIFAAGGTLLRFHAEGPLHFLVHESCCGGCIDVKRISF